MCFVTTGFVIIVFVFDDVTDGLRALSLSARVAFLKLSTDIHTEDKIPLRAIIKTKTLQSPDVVDEEEEGDPQQRTRDELPSWTRTVALVLLSWVQTIVGLIITECVATPLS